MADALTLVKANEASFRRYYELLIEWNERMNLTAITDPQEVYYKHFVDSVLIVDTSEWKQVVDTRGSVADVGTGAGFPGIPLAICHPELSFVLCDSLQKRIQFVQHVCAELGLKNVHAVHGRAEDLARDSEFRNRFDAVVSRAVARLNVLAEFTLPFVKTGGFVFSYKGPHVDDEMADGERAAHVLGGRITTTYVRALPGEFGERTIVVMVQDKPTPKAYPRKPGTPKKQPL
jgi:16S rRNA (guanine527-N7)-methyltransferase